MATITKEQIEKWKKEHGDVFELTVGEKKAYLKSPNRQILGYASVEAASDPFRFNEIILENCWLGGDESIKTDEKDFMAACRQLDKIIEVRESSIKKL